MPTYLNTLGEASLAIGICGRCQNKRKIADLVSDPNANGLRVCIYGCVDEYDPWRLPARANDKIDIQYPRPEDPLTPFQPIYVMEPVSTYNNISISNNVVSKQITGLSTFLRSTNPLPAGQNTYFEISLQTFGARSCVGLCKSTYDPTKIPSQQAAGVAFGYSGVGQSFAYCIMSGGNFDTCAAVPLTASPNSYTFGVAYDGTANTVIISLNNKALLSPAASSLGVGPWYPYIFTRASDGVVQVTYNFGEKPFVYLPPTGYNNPNV